MTAPAVTVAGAKVTLETAGIGGLTVKVAVFVTPEYTPVSVTAVDDATVEVGTVTWVEEVPAGTVTVAGTEAAAGTELVVVTAAPPGGAMPVSVTVRVALTPCTTTVGLTARDVRAAGLTVSVAVFDAPEVTAVIVVAAVEATPSDVTVNVVLVEPAGTVTVAGTVAAVGTELVKVTGDPPVGAAAESVTVAVDGVPLTTVVGLSARLDTGGGGALTVSVAVFVTPA